LKPISSPDLPPDDILDATVLPQGASPVPGSVRNLGVELYDRSLDFRVSAGQEVVIAFYRVQLPAQGWQILSQGPATGASAMGGAGFEVLAKHPSGDGYYWELGVVVAPTVFGSTGSGTGATRGSAPGSGPGSAGDGSAGGSATGTTQFTVRLFAVGDEG
jgi:hypothetical protein